MFAKLKKKLRDLLMKDCENCCLSWESRSMEGDCDCGCVLYGDLDQARTACFLPNLLLRPIRWKKDDEYSEAISRDADRMAGWFATEQKKQDLFLRALATKLFVDADGNPATPLYHSPSGKYHPYTPTDRWERVRVQYEALTASGTNPEKAFNQAIAEYLTPETGHTTHSASSRIAPPQGQNTTHCCTERTWNNWNNKTTKGGCGHGKGHILRVPDRTPCDHPERMVRCRR